MSTSQTHSGEQHEYTLGTNDAELQRLGLQHRLWAPAAQQLWTRAGLQAGATVLDVGCGPGYATLELAELVGPGGRVIAVDVSERYVAHLRQTLAARRISRVEALHSDVTRLPAPDNSVDFAYARWVLCWVQDPAAVVREVARVLRPGGVFAVQDYFDYGTLTLAPRGPAFERVVQAAVQSFRAAGVDPDVAGHLPGIFRRCGLAWKEVRAHYHTVRPRDLLWQWPTTFFANYVPRLVEQGLLTTAEQQAYEQEWAQRSADPDTFFCTPPVFDVVGVKGPVAG